MDRSSKRFYAGLLLGDAAAYTIVTILGFARHDGLMGAQASRMLATVLPFYAAWVSVAPWLGLFSVESPGARALLWRIPLACLFAAPLGAWLRGLLLDTPILPIFILVMAGVSALVMTGWRLLALRIARSQASR